MTFGWTHVPCHLPSEALSSQRKCDNRRGLSHSRVITLPRKVPQNRGLISSFKGTSWDAQKESITAHLVEEVCVCVWGGVTEKRRGSWLLSDMVVKDSGGAVSGKQHWHLEALQGHQESGGVGHLGAGSWRCPGLIQHRSRWEGKPSWLGSPSTLERRPQCQPPMLPGVGAPLVVALALLRCSYRVIQAHKQLHFLQCFYSFKSPPPIIKARTSSPIPKYHDPHFLFYWWIIVMYKIWVHCTYLYIHII